MAFSQRETLYRADYFHFCARRVFSFSELVWRAACSRGVVLNRCDRRPHRGGHPFRGEGVRNVKRIFWSHVSARVRRIYICMANDKKKNVLLKAKAIIVNQSEEKAGKTERQKK